MRDDSVIGGDSARPMLSRLSRGLILYGIVGIVLSVVAGVAVLLAIGRLSTIDDGVGRGVDQLGTVLDRMATVLDDAATSAGSFGSTIDTSSAALGTAAADLRGIVPRLRDIETQANAINILGSQPLAPLAGLFGQIASQLGDLDGRLDGVATSLSSNRAALKANASSLADLATQTRALSDRIAPDVLARTIADARWFAIALLAVVLAGVAAPATGALAFGLWLHRELQRAVVRPADPIPA